MASARARRRDKQLTTLVQENSQLHEDIENLETAYLLHRQNVQADNTGPRALLRKEIGGSRWEHGGAGKLTTYKVEKPADKLFATDLDSSRAEGRESARKSAKSTDDLLGHGHDNGVLDGDSGLQCPGNSRRVKAFAGMNSTGDDIKQESGDKISDLKPKVLKKASSKVIRRESWSNSTDTKTNHKAAESVVEVKPAPAKALNGSTSHTTKPKAVQRNNSFKNEKPALQKASKSKTESVKEKTFVKPAVEEKVARSTGDHSERRSRRDQYVKSSATKTIPNVDKKVEIVQNGDLNVPRQDVTKDVKSAELSSEERKSKGMTYTPRKIKPFVAERSPRVPNLFLTQQLEATEIYIDPKSGEVRVKSGTEDLASGLERQDGTVVLIQPGSARQSSERNKLPCTIVEDQSSHQKQRKVRDIFGLGTFDTVPNTSDATAPSGANQSSSPFTKAKHCNSEVEFWLRGLCLPDIDKYVKIFADHEIDLLDLEFMSASQLHEMGVTGIGVLDKILKGIRDLKSASSKDSRHGGLKKKHLTAASIAWEDVDNNSVTTAGEGLTTSTSKSGILQQSCHDTNTNNNNFTDTRHERFNSALSNTPEPDFARDLNLDSQPSFAANTMSSSAKLTDRRPPSAKGSGGTKHSSAPKGTSTSEKVANRSTKKPTRSNSVSEKSAPSKGNNLDSKPKKGVLLRTRSSSLNREFSGSKGQLKKGQEEEKAIREPRVRSRSADAVKRKAMEGVQAAAKKFEVIQHKNKEGEKLPQGRPELKARRDKMAARHLQREKNKETNIGDAVTNEGMEVVAVTTAGDSSPGKDEGLESLVTVNIMSTPHSAQSQNDLNKSSTIIYVLPPINPRRGAPEDLTNTQVLSQKSELQKSLRRVEPAKKSRSRPTVPQLESELEPPLLSTYKLGGRDQGQDKGRDRQLAEAESSSRSASSSTYTEVQEKVSEIQLKIKRLKAKATSGDDMTLTLVRDLQGQLRDFEKQLSNKERDIRRRRRHRGQDPALDPGQGAGQDPSPDLGAGEDQPRSRKSRKSRSRSRSRDRPTAITETLNQLQIEQFSSPTPTPRTPVSSSGRISPLKDLRASPTKDMLASQTTDPRASPRKDLRASPTKDQRASPTKDMLASQTMDLRASPRKDLRASPTKDMLASQQTTNLRASPTKDLLASTLNDRRATSPTKDLLASSRSDLLQLGTTLTPTERLVGGGEGEADIVRMSKKELLHEMRKEKKHHHRQIRQLQTELERIRHNDPVSVMELSQKDILYDKHDLIGEGMFSKVYKGRYQGSEVAVKCLKAPLQSQDKNYFTAEVSLLKELRHPRVVLLVGVCTSSKLPLMMLEYMSQGSLLKHLHNTDKDSLDHALYYQIARDIAAGMNYLHSHRPEVLHLDLKSNNIMLCQSFRAKIADFGFSKLRHEAGERTGSKKTKSGKQFPSSLPWMAPELLDKGEVTCKADVYSFAVILWEMLSRQAPYQDCGVFQVLELVRKKKRPTLPASTPEGLQQLIQDSWDANPARRPQFKDVIPRLETLAFPPAWRDLFKKAGVPDAALQNLESTRKIINIVSSTLGGANKSVVNSFMLPPARDSTLSGTRESTLTSSRQNSDRKGDDDTSNWEAETISTLSGRLSSDESQITVKNLLLDKSEDLESVSSGSDDDSSYSSGNSYRKESEKQKPPKIDVFLPNLELQLQSARDEFKAERSKIERTLDWVSISMDDRSYRSEEGQSQRTSQRGQDVPSRLNLNLTDRSSSSTHRYISDGETLDETARSLILSKQSKTKDLSMYSDDHWMRESLDNMRPPSPAKRSFSSTLTDTTGSNVSDIFTATPQTPATPQTATSEQTSVDASSENLPTRARARTLSNVDSSKDSFFGIPIHRQAAPAAVMSQESLNMVKTGESLKGSNEELDRPNSSKRRSLQSQERASSSSSIVKQSYASRTNIDVTASVSDVSDVEEATSLSVEDNNSLKQKTVYRRESEDSGKSSSSSSGKPSGISTSSSFPNDVEHHISAVAKAFITSMSEDKLDMSSARDARDSPSVSTQHADIREKQTNKSTTIDKETKTPTASFSKEPSRSHSRSSCDTHVELAGNRSSNTLVHNYLNNSVTICPQDTLSSRSERGHSVRGKTERESGGIVTKSLDCFAKTPGRDSANPTKVSSSFITCPEELSKARERIMSRSVKVDRSKDSNNVFNSHSADIGTGKYKKDAALTQDVGRTRTSSKATKLAEMKKETDIKTVTMVNTMPEKEQVRVKLNPKEVDAKRLSLSGSVKLKQVEKSPRLKPDISPRLKPEISPRQKPEISPREKPAITPRKSKSISESRDSVNISDSLTSSNSLAASQSKPLEKSVDSQKHEDKIRVRLVNDSKFNSDGGSVQANGNTVEAPSASLKDTRKEGAENRKANTIKIKLRRDPLDRMPVKQVEKQDQSVSSPVTLGEKENTHETEADQRNKTISNNSRVQEIEPDQRKSKSKKASAGATRPGNKSTIKVKVRKDPMAPQPSLVPSSPVPPAPPPPPPSFSVGNFSSKSVQEEGNRMSMADEIKLRLNNRQSISEGCRVDPRGNIMRPASKHGAKQGVRPGGTILEGEANGAGGKGLLAPKQSEGLPSFMVASVELKDQKGQLRSISRPHPDQDEQGHVSQEQLSSIADILKKAVMGRRVAMHEGGESVSQSMESTATGWSVDTGI